MSWLLMLLGLALPLGALVAVLLWLGSRLPMEHVASCRARLAVPPERAFAAISDVGALASWRAGVSRVELLEPQGSLPRFREHSRHGAILYAVEALEAPRRMVTRIADDALPFGGTWTYEVAPEGAGCQVTLTERGLVRPPLFRALSRFAFGYTRTMEEYLRSLGRKFGEDAQVEVLDPGHR